jgi:UDP-3-O-[3-hydroxymyristoyl] N-acetylglucosamine deacetylase
MKNTYQNTILNDVSFNGIGLHTGKMSNVRLLPANENTGIIFKRTDLKSDNIIKANFNNVSSSKLCTTLKNSAGTTISTIEHLMAAFYITGVDNVIVEIDNIELPIMDGSSKEFIKIINQIGLIKQSAKRKFLKIKKKIELKENNKIISIEPNDESLEVEFQLNYSNSLIGNQKNQVDFYNHDLKDIYSSRTFCLYEDIETIKKQGLAKGGSLENAIVVKDKEIMNEGGLRNDKEFVNHKILDLAGDFLLSGYRILGKVKCKEGGHNLSNNFLKKIFNDQSNFEDFTVNNVELFKKDIKAPVNKLAVNA